MKFKGFVKAVLIDSNSKKINFLKKAILKLGLMEECQLIKGRVEEIAHDKGCRELFDFAVTRAFAHPLMALEYGFPFVKVGGWLYIYYTIDMCKIEYNDAVSLNGPYAADNKKDALVFIAQKLKEHSNRLGGHVASVEEAQSLGIGEGFLIIKDSPTPAQFPRKHAVVKRGIAK